MNTIKNIGDNYTIILIAHRLTTVENCDRIIELRQGEIIRNGPPSEILEY